MNTNRIGVALFIMRITAAIFLGLWATLKFHRPEWAENIWKGAYKFEHLGLENLSVEVSYGMGVIQLAIVFAFALGLWRFWTYGLMMLMSAALMLTSIPTLGALIALFLLRDLDNFLSVPQKTKNAEVKDPVNP